MTNAEKANFIKTDVPRLLEDLRAKATPWWGVMTAQNMLEHLSWSLQNSVGKNRVFYKRISPQQTLRTFKNLLLINNYERSVRKISKIRKLGDHNLLRI